MTDRYQAYTPDECLNKFAEEASKAKNTLVAHAMLIDDDEIGQKILEAFQNASACPNRRAIWDYFTKVNQGDNFFLVNSLVPIKSVSEEAFSIKFQKDEFLDELKRLTTDQVFLNTPLTKLKKRLPLTGRVHTKGLNRDYESFYFGGLNFNRATADCCEVMVEFVGEEAKILGQTLDKIANGSLKSDCELQLNNQSKLMYDAGIPGKSGILEKAIELIENSQKSVLNSSFFYPDFPIAKHLNDAWEREIDVSVLSSIPLPEKPLPLGWNNFQLAITSLNLATDLINRYKFPVYLNDFRSVHYKLLLVDNEHAIFGTHNLSGRSVKAGTQEWAIYTTDQNLIEPLRTKFYDFIQETDEKINWVI